MNGLRGVVGAANAAGFTRKVGHRGLSAVQGCGPVDWVKALYTA
jgi:hypothetical protein